MKLDRKPFIKILELKCTPVFSRLFVLLPRNKFSIIYLCCQFFKSNLKASESEDKAGSKLIHIRIKAV